MKLSLALALILAPEVMAGMCPGSHMQLCKMMCQEPNCPAGNSLAIFELSLELSLAIFDLVPQTQVFLTLGGSGETMYANQFAGDQASAPCDKGHAARSSA